MEYIGQLMLKLILPQSGPIPVAATAIGQDEQFGSARIVGLTKRLPPPSNRSHSELGRIGRCADEDIARIQDWIVNAVRDRNALGQGAKVINIHPMGITTPDFTRVLEQPNQFALFGVNMDDRPTTLQKGPFLALHVLKLLIPVRAGNR
jgi:hypothetical protein